MGGRRAPAGAPHYLVCNADESEPGTFKDRVLMESDPFALVEAMTIAAYATGCEHGYVYMRAEYPLAHARLEHAFAQARAAGLLGGDVLGAGFAFDIELRIGAGAYVCGEETALFQSIEGYRGEPRNKPPFPVEVGLFGKPTVVNNVETLVQRAGVLAGDGTADTRLFCVSGHVERPGVYEVRSGMPLRELLELAGPRPPKAVLLGGAAGTFLRPDQLDLPLSFEGRARPAPRSAPASSSSSTSRRISSTRCCASRRSSATSRAASACLPRRHRAPGGGAAPARVAARTGTSSRCSPISTR